MANPVSRREFIGTATSGMLLAGGLAARPTEAADNAGWPKMTPVKVYVAYLGTGGAWPKPEFDAPADQCTASCHTPIQPIFAFSPNYSYCVEGSAKRTMWIPRSDRQMVRFTQPA